MSAPSSANLNAVARPIPRLAPVTMTAMPSRGFVPRRSSATVNSQAYWGFLTIPARLLPRMKPHCAADSTADGGAGIGPVDPIAPSNALRPT